jgi:ArsR family transcriptional regulator
MKSLLFLKSISNNTKLRLVSLLLENELCVCELEEITNIRQANISKNLISLKESGIVDVRREKQRAFYFLSQDFLDNKFLIEHINNIKMNEAILIKDHKVFMKHEEVKDNNIYVCNVFKNEVN